MKSKVKLSAYCIVITILVIVGLLAGIISCRSIESKLYPLIIILTGLVATGLFYFPTSIEAGDSALLIHRPLRTKAIPYAEITRADRCIPSAGGLRLCGSGGFLGFWGYFNDIIIGSYFGYYGDHSQCILLKLKGGKQYVISCADPDRMSATINARLKA